MNNNTVWSEKNILNGNKQLRRRKTQLAQEKNEHSKKKKPTHKEEKKNHPNKTKTHLNFLNSPWSEKKSSSLPSMKKQFSHENSTLYKKETRHPQR